MKNTLKIDFAKRMIIMDRTFAKYAENTRSEEYAHLQQVLRDYPTYELVKRTIKKNASKKTYHGLTYDYMRDYIILHAVDKNKEIADFNELLLRAKCQSKAIRYPTIKKWFLNKYPEIEMFGCDVSENDKTEETEVTYEKLSA